MPTTNYIVEDLPNGSEFENLGLAIMGRQNSRCSAESRKCRFVAFFGMEPAFVAFTWRELITSGWTRFSGSRGANPEHLLWCLHFLKTYSTEEIVSARVEANEKTFRRWAWFYAEGIANLDRKFVSTSAQPAPPLLLNRCNVLIMPHASPSICAPPTDSLGEPVPRRHRRALPCHG